MWAGIGYLTV